MFSVDLYKYAFIFILNFYGRQRLYKVIRITLLLGFIICINITCLAIIEKRKGEGMNVYWNEV